MNLLQQKLRQQQSNLFTNLTLFSEAHNEKFTDVRVVTSTAYQKDKAIELAFILGATIKNVEQKAKELLKEIPKEQFIEIYKDSILVVLDVYVIDDGAIDKTFTLLAQVPEFKVGQRITIDVSKIHS